MSSDLLGSSAIILSEGYFGSDSIRNKYGSKFSRSARQKHQDEKPEEKEDTNYTYKMEIVWFNVFTFFFLHCGMLYGLYLLLTVTSLKTFIFTSVIYFSSGTGITAGAHRLWSHRSYKADLPMRIILAIFQTLAFQNTIYEWVRDHRVHHKFTDTDADPHNSTRGFFFSHMGWLMVKKHRDVIIKGKTVDMTDLERDPVVMFQKKYFMIVMPLCSFILPTLIPWYFWNESFWVSFYVSAILRYVLSLNGTWLVNSAAHIWGAKPYEQTISAAENPTVAFITGGEGWHNYHHVFPWDFKAAELGTFSSSFTTNFIKFFAFLGLAHDLKTVSPEMIAKRVLRTGDSTHRLNGLQDHSHGDAVWGWDDQDMTQEDREDAQILNETVN